MQFKQYKKEDMENVKKIGILMFGLLGDILLRTPVLRALREIYPNAELIAIVNSMGEQVLLNNKSIDKVLLFKQSKTNKIMKNFTKIKNILSIRDEKFDLLINLYNGGSSPLMMFLSGARYKLGFCQQKNKYIYNIQNICENDRLRAEQTLNSYMISIIEPLSKKKFSLQPEFSISDKKLKNINSVLNEYAPSLDKVYTLNLGASQEDKILENEKYFFLIKYIYIQYGFIPAIVSNPGQEYLQENFINDFMKDSDIKYIKLDNMSLESVAAVIELTRFMVTPDTGLMHLSMALNTYTYTIFTYTHPVFVDPQNNNFISVYESFDEGKLYQHQNISNKELITKIDLLFSRIS